MTRRLRCVGGPLDGRIVDLLANMSWLRVIGGQTENALSADQTALYEVRILRSSGEHVLQFVRFEAPS